MASAQSIQSLQTLRFNVRGDVYIDAQRRGLYATDASIYQTPPAAVVAPRDANDVIAVVQFAAEHRLAVTPRGAGTSLSGQAIGPGILIDFSRYMNQVLSIDAANRVARVEPGVVLDELNRRLAPERLTVGPDVSTIDRATVGGMLGNNSAGSRSIRYGKMVDSVRRVEFVAADGKVRELGPRRLEGANSGDDFFMQRVAAELRAILGEHRETISARFPAILRRVSGYNLDELVPEFLRVLPLPEFARAARERDHELVPDADVNLARLLVGAEGTLGAVVSAELCLAELPRRRAVASLEFDSLDAAVASLEDILKLSPSAVELFDGMIPRLARNSLEYRKYLDFVVGDPESMLLVEFSGDDDQSVVAAIDALTELMHGRPGFQHAVPAATPTAYDKVWKCRKAALPLLMGVPGARKPIAFVEDTAVSPEKLAAFVARFRDILQDHGVDGAYYGHASVGCLHIRPLLDTSNQEDVERLRDISLAVGELVAEFGGSFSGEHGDGMARSYHNEKLFGPELYQAFRRLKAAFDPAGIFNPGKVVDGPDPTENLRSGPGVAAPRIETNLSFAREGGFRAAAELCNGSAVCRKLRTGTMCPSFMATRDEQHSTRGRANALRLVLSGAVAPEELTGEGILQTFDLCLQCKGCKAECPSNVDVGKMKTELLDARHKQFGTPLGARMAASVAALNRWGSRFAPVSNWLAATPPSRWLLAKTTGVDPRRPLPQFDRHAFGRWFDRRPQPNNASSAAPRGDVVLLDDCLTSYCEPAVPRAAVQVLERLGYRVHRAGITCCGRAALSKGCIDVARAFARQNVARLQRWLEAGTPIVGVEPSCVLTLADDYRDLLDEEVAAPLASIRLIDDFLAEAEPLTSSASASASTGESVLLHGHCHQKALVGVEGSVGALALHAGLNAEVVDSGCCGMAGTFGYEHYDLSLQIGERVLFPAVREARERTIVAPGFSCRHQIAHGAGRAAIHPVQLIARACGLGDQ